MGALGNEERVNYYKQKFESAEVQNSVEGGQIPRYHFGSHYSNPAIVLNYLMRLEEFTTGVKELFNGKFDIPDR